MQRHNPPYIIVSIVLVVPKMFFATAFEDTIFVVFFNLCHNVLIWKEHVRISLFLGSYHFCMRMRVGHLVAVLNCSLK